MESAPSNSKRRRRAQVAALVIFLAFSVLELHELFSNPPDFATLGSDVFIIAGAIVFPTLASIYFLSIFNNWTMEREGWAVKWTFRCAIAAIILFVLALVFFR
jgi:hypothetical protein